MSTRMYRAIFVKSDHSCFMATVWYRNAYDAYMERERILRLHKGEIDKSLVEDDLIIERAIGKYTDVEDHSKRKIVRRFKNPKHTQTLHIVEYSVDDSERFTRVPVDWKATVDSSLGLHDS